MLFSEDQLVHFSKPLSDTEETRCENAIRMVRDALARIGYTDNGNQIRKLVEDTWSFSLPMSSNTGKEITILVQGSYANNTNIRAQSDVDIAVILESSFIPKYRPGVVREQYGFSEGTTTVQSLKDDVEKALRIHFDNKGVERKNKSIKVHGNSYRVDADVVPAYRYRDYSADFRFDPNNFVGAIEIRPDDGSPSIINYPEQHIRNGKRKNTDTGYKFKKMVRIFKNIRSLMADDSASNVSSFGIESLLWNLSDVNYSAYNNFLNTTDYLLNQLNGDLHHFKEVNGIKELFPNETDYRNYKIFLDDFRKFFVHW